jgi:hypothetical protein
MEDSNEPGAGRLDCLGDGTSNIAMANVLTLLLGITLEL